MEPWLAIVRDKRFKTGVTPAYLLGALRVVDGRAEQDSEEEWRRDLASVLATARDDLQAPCCVVLQPCRDTKSHVLAWHRSVPEGREPIRSSWHEGRAIYHCRQIDGHEITSFESLIDGIWAAQGQFVLQGRFSREELSDLRGKRRMEWVCFSENEREEIRKTVAEPDDRTRS